MLERQEIQWNHLSIIAALLVHLCTGVWYASTLSARVSGLEEKTATIVSDHELLVRMDERIRTMYGHLSDIRQTLAEGKQR